MITTGDTNDLEYLKNIKDKVDVLFVTPWLLRKIVTEGITEKFGQIIIYHHRFSNRPVYSSENIFVLDQGEVITLKK
jgi:hypothetical protein